MGTYIYIGIMLIIVLGICSGIFNENSCEEETATASKSFSFFSYLAVIFF